LIENEAKRSLGKRNEAKKLNRDEANKNWFFVLTCACKKMRNVSYFASFRFEAKKILCKTGAPYAEGIQGVTFFLSEIWSGWAFFAKISKV
jgi:hypothetical protein